MSVNSNFEMLQIFSERFWNCNILTLVNKVVFILFLSIIFTLHNGIFRQFNKAKYTFKFQFHKKEKKREEGGGRKRLQLFQCNIWITYFCLFMQDGFWKLFLNLFSSTSICICFFLRYFVIGAFAKFWFKKMLFRAKYYK